MINPTVNNVLHRSLPNIPSVKVIYSINSVDLKCNQSYDNFPQCTRKTNLTISRHSWNLLHRIKTFYFFSHLIENHSDIGNILLIICLLSSINWWPPCGRPSSIVQSKLLPWKNSDVCLFVVNFIKECVPIVNKHI